MRSTTIVQRVARRLRSGGLRWLVGAVFERIVPARPSMRGSVLHAVDRQTGLEIGGPSRVFGPRGPLPIYRCATRIDNVNYAPDTAWEGALVDGAPFHFNPQRTSGTQWLREATALTGIADASYDFVLSSHCLEHVANPLRALREWRRVTRPGGHLVLVLPDPARSFDHRRPITSLAHLREDAIRGTAESDLTHAAEAIALHDIARDPGVGSRGEFEIRVRDNVRNRCLHHHVFDLDLVRAALAETGWHVLAAEAVRPLHLLAFARKEGT